MSTSTINGWEWLSRWRQRRAQRRRGFMQSLTTANPSEGTRGGGRLVPKPVLPTRPVLSLAALGARGNTRIASVLNHKTRTEVTSGRAAIALALLDMSVRPGDEILIPAYHCPAMVDPVVWAKCKPVFYRLGSDLSIDLEDVRAKRSERTRAVIAVHYFGFSHALDALRSFCDANKLMMIEDCAHSAFGVCSDRVLGSWGDYAIACHTKFFPTYEGGALIANRALAAPIGLKATGLGFTLATAIAPIQRALSYERLWLLEPLMALAETAGRAVRSLRTREPARSESPVMEAGIPGQFAAEWVDIGMSFVSRFLYRRLSWCRIVERRRSNYLVLARLLAGVPGVRLLYPALPDGIVPHVLPVIVDLIDEVFPELEDAGVPMQRFGQFLWAGVDADTCDVAWKLSRMCVQFACHEDLTTQDIEWIAHQIRGAISKTSDGGRPQ